MRDADLADFYITAVRYRDQQIIQVEYREINNNGTLSVAQHASTHHIVEWINTEYFVNTAYWVTDEEIHNQHVIHARVSGLVKRVNQPASTLEQAWVTDSLVVKGVATGWVEGTRITAPAAQLLSLKPQDPRAILGNLPHFQ